MIKVTTVTSEDVFTANDLFAGMKELNGVVAYHAFDGKYHETPAKAKSTDSSVIVEAEIGGKCFITGRNHNPAKANESLVSNDEVVFIAGDHHSYVDLKNGDRITYTKFEPYKLADVTMAKVTTVLGDVILINFDEIRLIVDENLQG